jgi:hypothetical protein
MDPRQHAAAATHRGHRDRKALGLCLRRRLGQHRLASPGKTGRVHQSEVRAAHREWLCSLGKNRAGTCWSGSWWRGGQGQGGSLTDFARLSWLFHRYNVWRDTPNSCANRPMSFAFCIRFRARFLNFWVFQFHFCTRSSPFNASCNISECLSFGGHFSSSQLGRCHQNTAIACLVIAVAYMEYQPTLIENDRFDDSAAFVTSFGVRYLITLGIIVVSSSSPSCCPRREHRGRADSRAARQPPGSTSRLERSSPPCEKLPGHQQCSR